MGHTRLKEMETEAAQEPQGLVLPNSYSIVSSLISVSVMPVDEINRPITLNLEGAELHLL